MSGASGFAFHPLATVKFHVFRAAAWAFDGLATLFGYETYSQALDDRAVLEVEVFDLTARVTSLQHQVNNPQEQR